MMCSGRARRSLGARQAHPDMESYAGMVRETLENLAPEGCHRTYKLLRLSVNFLPDWPLEIMGVFAEVAEEAEVGSSKCKPSPLSV